MAVHAHHQYLAHAFPHETRAIRPELDNTSAVLGGHLPTSAAQQGLGGSTGAFSDLICNNNNNNNGGWFAPRKRARVGDLPGAGLTMVEGHGALLPLLPAQQQALGGSTGAFSDLTCIKNNNNGGWVGDLPGAGFTMKGHGALLPPLPAPQQAFAPAGHAQSRVLCSAAASTSGHPSSAAPASHGLLSLLYRHSLEIDALVRIENERLRAGLEAARRRHVRAAVSAMERAAAGRLRGAEAELERALVRNAELEEKLRQTSAEGQAWQGVARSHEAVAAGLRATLDQLLQSPRGTSALGEGDAEDAQSCCFEEQEDGARARARACKACGGADACVLLLPCRHLCLCAGCEAAVDACPVCAATKNASLHVLLS